MKGFLYKLRPLPLVLGAVTLGLGAVLRLLWGKSDTVLIYGGALFVGGIIFLQAMRQLRAEEEAETRARDNASPVEATFTAKAEEDVAAQRAAQKYRLGNALPFLLVRAFMSLLIICFGVAAIMQDKLLWGGVLLLAGAALFLLHVSWTRENRATAKTLNMERSAIALKPFARQTIPGFEGEEPELLIQEDGRTLLLFQMFPPENERLAALVTGNFAESLALAIGAEVHHEDRELFRIESNDPVVIDKLLAFFAR